MCMLVHVYVSACVYKWSRCASCSSSLIFTSGRVCVCVCVCVCERERERERLLYSINTAFNEQACFVFNLTTISHDRLIRSSWCETVSVWVTGSLAAVPGTKVCLTTKWKLPKFADLCKTVANVHSQTKQLLNCLFSPVFQQKLLKSLHWKAVVVSKVSK